MGTISRFNVYSSGDLLTAANLNGSLDRIHNLINGGLDRFNVDYSSSDGIMVLDQAQTVTGNKTYNANLTISADTATNSLDVASHNASSAGLKLAGTLVTATAAELNKMDGVTSSTTELNLLDGITAINDQDDMSGNSATALATQQSIKAYVDAQIATEDTIAELNDTTIGSLAAGNVLIYDGTDSWDNKPLTGDVTITAGGVTAIEAGVILNADINASAAIADTKLATISTSDKVSGSAVQLASTSALENSTGLRIKSGTAGTGLSLASQVLSVDASQTQITAVGTIATGTWEATDVAVAHGGTGSSTASGARTNLGVAVGSDVQAYDAGLASIAGLTTAANKMIYTTGADTYAVIDLTSIGRDILADVDAAAVRTTIGAQASGSYQTSDAGLTSIAGLTTAANKMIYTTGADTYTVADLTSVGRDIIAGADAAAVRTTIGAQASGTYSTLAYKTIAVSGQDNVVADAADDTLTFAAGTGITLTTTAGTDTLTITNSATGANAFGTIAVSGQDNVVADSTGDTLTLAAGSNITLTTTAGSDTVTIAAGSSGHTIQEEGSGLTARANLNFVGSGVTATDDSGNNATKVTVSASGASLPFTNSNGGSDAIALTSAAIGESLVSDTSPQLGGDLDVNGQSIVSDASNENIPITPHGTGSVVISKLSVTGDTSLDGGSFVFNESGADKDFRIEGDTQANLFVADASTDRIGIGTATPDHIFHAQDVGANSFNTKFVLDLENTRRSGYTQAAIELASEYGTPGAGNFRTSAIAAELIGDQTATDIVFYSESTERMRITTGGSVGVGDLSAYSGGSAHPEGAPPTGSTNAKVLKMDGGLNVDAALQISGYSDIHGLDIWTDVSTGDVYFDQRGNHDDYDFRFRTKTTGSPISAFTITGAGAISKSSGSFKIDHPLPEKTDTHHLVHSFVEGPQADLLYRGTATLSSGTATVNIDTAARMTDGTFVALNGNVQAFTTNETAFDNVRALVSGNILTITSEDNTSTATISWLVVGERKDAHMVSAGTTWTDSDGRVITEPSKESDADRMTPARQAAEAESA